MNSGTIKKNGEVFYPYTQANLVKTSDGQNIEEAFTKKSRFVTISGVTDTVTWASLVELPYPSGFNVNNCVMISCMYEHPIGDIWIQHNSGVSGQLRSGYVGLYSSGEDGTRGLNVKITLMRID